MSTFNRFKFRSVNKYGAKRSKCEKGHNHASALEAGVCNTLHRTYQGEIKQQAKVELSDAAIPWKIDFKFYDDSGVLCYAEAKGMETYDYQIKKKLFEHYGDGKLYIYKGTHDRHKVSEVITPKRYKEEK